MVALDLQEVSDRLEIEMLLTRYCTAIDAKNFDLLDEVFTEDAVIDYSSSAPGVRGNRAEMKKWLSEVLAGFAMTQHLVANKAIEINGDTATGRTMLYNPMGWLNEKGDLEVFFVGGYYNDRFVRTALGWRIAQRVEEQSWATGARPPGAS